MNTRRQEPHVSVGIVKAERLSVVFHSAYRLEGKAADGVFAEALSLEDTRVEGAHTFSVADAGCRFVPVGDDASFTLEEVQIGIGFHWQRTEAQTFRGALQLVEEDGRIWAVNVLPVETYLASVISSEMSAHASLELLKAHAVVSRSWLWVMMRKAEQRVRTKALHEELGEGSILRWYDNEAHHLFDVCADDHCQRYQGITRQTTPRVAEAVEATRGLVLTYEGEVCDARFSKCCGGRTEVFETCWEDVPHPYLVVKDDPYCGRADAQVVSQVLNGYDRESPDFLRWHVRYTHQELTEVLRRKSGIDFGRILALQPVSRGGSGRLQRLRIVGEKCTVTVGKELEIRKWLSDTCLRSSAFTVEPQPDGFQLHGMGWGHGVGLCQIGAAVMGNQGIPYEDILAFYYPHTQLTILNS